MSEERLKCSPTGFYTVLFAMRNLCPFILLHHALDKALMTTLADTSFHEVTVLMTILYMCPRNHPVFRV